MFAIVLCFSLIILYDATNLRRSAGYHAQVLNTIVPQLLKGKVVKYGEQFPKLHELLGHTPLEVFVGAVLGVGIALGCFHGLAIDRRPVAMRLLDYVLAAGLAADQRSARGLIMRGDVLVNDQAGDLAAAEVREGAACGCVAASPKASRAGLAKLRPALKRTGFEVAGRVCLDLGVSTGGFTRCCWSWARRASTPWTWPTGSRRWQCATTRASCCWNAPTRGAVPRSWCPSRSSASSATCRSSAGARCCRR